MMHLARDVLQSYGGRPFAWGKADCLCVVADVAAAACGRRTGLDEPIGRYSDRYGAARWLRDSGHGRLDAFVDESLRCAGWTEIPPPVAGFFDIGISQGGVLCVRVSGGFVARDAVGVFGVVQNVRRAWTWRN